MNDLRDLLKLADTAAAAAGEALLANRAQWGVIDEIQGREVKIGGDKHAEEIVLTAIARDSDYPIISEEAGWARAMQRGDRFVWAIDPLDGSVNYLRGYPHCAVSIALLDQGKPILGVVDCFVMRERFTGVVGQGAWLNGAPMQVSDIENPAKGILQTGVPSRAGDESMKAFEQRLRTWQKVRMIGSAWSVVVSSFGATPTMAWPSAPVGRRPKPLGSDTWPGLMRSLQVTVTSAWPVIS